MGKLLPKDIQNLKGRRKITKVTALDYFSARAIGKSGIDILQDLGIVWLEIECMPYKIASEITKLLKIPTIGIGSGPGCDGQFPKENNSFEINEEQFNLFKDALLGLISRKNKQI